MPPKSVPGIRLEPRPSPLLFRLRLGVHLFALVAAAVSGLPLGQRLLLIGIVSAAAVMTLRPGDARPRIRQILLKSDGRWLLVLHDGRSIAAELSAASISSPLLVWLVWRTPGAAERLLVVPDSLPERQFRELRVALRVVASHGLN